MVIRRSGIRIWNIYIYIYKRIIIKNNMQQDRLTMHDWLKFNAVPDVLDHDSPSKKMSVKKSCKEFDPAFRESL